MVDRAANDDCCWGMSFLHLAATGKKASILGKDLPWHLPSFERTLHTQTMNVSR
jgi:hypothetical protein